jgi:hypothetical protein
VPALLDWAKADLGSTVAGTRTAAIAMVRVRRRLLLGLAGACMGMEGSQLQQTPSIATA